MPAVITAGVALTPAVSKNGATDAPLVYGVPALRSLDEWVLLGVCEECSRLNTSG